MSGCQPSSLLFGLMPSQHQLLITFLPETPLDFIVSLFFCAFVLAVPSFLKNIDSPESCAWPQTSSISLEGLILSCG